jgi:hypothetical protein
VECEAVECEVAATTTWVGVVARAVVGSETLLPGDCETRPGRSKGMEGYTSEAAKALKQANGMLD